MDLRGITEFIKDFWYFILPIIILIFVMMFIVSFNPVAGNSMAPTLEEGQVVVLNRLAYKVGKVSRDDIVIIKVNGKSYIKRVIGLPGEKVEYMNGYLYINGETYKEDFLTDDVVTNNFLFEDICSKEDCPEEVIPENKYLVLGDNRPESMDSRSKEIGLIDINQIDGKVVFSVWPLNDFGKVN